MQHVCLICQPFSSPLVPLCLQGCFSPGIWSLMWFRTLYQMNRDQGSVHHYENRAILDCSRFVKCCIKITQSDFRFLISFRGVSCKLPRKQAARKSSGGGGSQLRTVTYLFKAPNTCSMEEADRGHEGQWQWSDILGWWSPSLRRGTRGRVPTTTTSHISAFK